MRKRSQSRMQSLVKSQPPLISRGTLKNKPHLKLVLLKTRELGFQEPFKAGGRNANSQKLLSLCARKKSSISTVSAVFVRRAASAGY